MLNHCSCWSSSCALVPLLAIHVAPLALAHGPLRVGGLLLELELARLHGPGPRGGVVGSFVAHGADRRPVRVDTHEIGNPRCAAPTFTRCDSRPSGAR